jgi:hypothetical protein
MERIQSQQYHLITHQEMVAQLLGTPLLQIPLEFQLQQLLVLLLLLDLLTVLCIRLQSKQSIHMDKEWQVLLIQ